MCAVIKSGDSTDQLKIDSTSKAARVTLYSTAGVEFTSLQGTVLTTNSSTTALGVSGVFTGTGVDVSSYGSITVACLSDVAGILYAEFSTDNTNWDSSLGYIVQAGINEFHRLSITRKYFRCRYVNDGTIQSYMRLQCLAGNQPILTSALNTTIRSDSDAILTRTTDFKLDLSRGLVANMTTINKFGRNSDIDIGTEDIWGAGGTWVQTTAATTVNIVSSSVNDTAAGTGARTISVNGLDSNYNVITETLSLSGAVAVTTVNTYWIIHRIIVLTAGTGATNAGTITSVWTGGGTPVGPSITIGKGQTQFCIYQIPAGYSGYLERYQGGMNGGALLDLELWNKPFGGIYNLKGTLLLNLTGNSYQCREYETPLKFEAKSIVKLTGTASANNTDVVGGFDIILIED
jgi:hypothetical protein